MKNAYWLLILLLVTTLLTVSGQVPNAGSSKKWSAAVTASPISTFNYYHSKWNTYDNFHSKGITEAIYSKGANFRIEKEITGKLALSTGFNYKLRKNEIFISGFDMFYYETSTENKYIIEIPVLIRYTLLNSPGFFDPYIITGIRNSYFKRDYVGTYTRFNQAGTANGIIDKHEGRFFLFYNLGAGTYLNISKPLSVILESNLTYTISGYGYLEVQGGLRYSFK